MKSAIALFSPRDSALLEVVPGTVEGFAIASNFSIEPGNGGGRLYRKGERWPALPIYTYVETTIRS